VQLTASLEATGRLVPTCAQQERLAEQTPCERLRAHRFGLLGERQRLARIAFDVCCQPVAVQVVLADAVMDVEHTRERRGPLTLVGQPFDLEVETPAPVSSEM
jgi:hypothetical protein